MTEITVGTPRLETVIAQALEYRLARVHVCLPAVVRAYDAATQLADCEPLVKNRIAFGDGTFLEETHPVIPDVPVAWPRAGSSFLHLPLAAGDLVTLVFSEQSYDHARTLGGTGPQSPLTIRRHSLADAIAMPNSIGGTPIAGLSSTATTLVAPEIRLGTVAPTDAAALASRVLAELTDLVVTLQTLQAAIAPLNGALGLLATPAAAVTSPANTALVVAATGAMTAVGAAITALLASPWPASVASSRVKVDS